MSLLLKIVQGPNVGAEIALVEGVTITLGKADTCDIVLADMTMPADPIKVETVPDGVLLDGERLEPLQVVVRGSTAFAVGPADSAWGELKWPKVEENREEREAEELPAEGDSRAAAAAPEAPSSAPEPGEEKEKPGKKRRGCMGCLVALILLLLALAALGWFFREQARPYAERVFREVRERSSGASGKACPSGEPLSLAAVIARRNIVETERDGRKVFVGDFSTRAERLAATAEVYAAQPGAELDFADGESLKTAVADTLALVGETKLNVLSVTNRVAVIEGSAANLKRTLEAVAADVPKLVNVDVGGVTSGHVLAKQAEGDEEDLPFSPGAGFSLPRAGKRRAARNMALPVCGILTTPYPCLVLRNGARILEGAPIGDSTVLKIEADSVTITNATGRFVWKP